MSSANMVRNYGWKGTKPPCSCAFVALKVLDILKKLGVSSAIDIGCGNGALCGMLKKNAIDVSGAEYDAEGCRLAQQAYPGIKIYNIGVYDSPAPIQKDKSDGFDCVISTEVVEHLFSPQYLPIFAATILRPEGYLIVSTPYHGFLKNLALAIFNYWDAHHSSLWEGGHIKFWSKKTITQLLETNGFKVLGFYGVGRFPFLWKSMILLAQKKESR